MSKLKITVVLFPLWLSSHAMVAGNDVEPNSQRPAATQTPTRSAADVITIVGCVQREADYRAQIKDGKGGAAGTGVGADNEVVLHSIRTLSSETLKPTATSRIGPDEVYSVTGNLEREVAKVVGRQVAMSGYVEVATTDGTDRVRDLPRFNAAGWHTVADKCPAAPPKR